MSGEGTPIDEGLARKHRSVFQVHTKEMQCYVVTNH
jgi:hypothetical protein